MGISKLLLTVFFCGVMVAPAFSQDAPGGSSPQDGQQHSGDVTLDITPFFDSTDTNKDDNVSTEEWVSAGLDEGLFKFFDQQSQGFFTKKALADMQHPSAIDADKDGRMTLEEVIKFTSGLPKPTE